MANKSNFCHLKLTSHNLEGKDKINKNKIKINEKMANSLSHPSLYRYVILKSLKKLDIVRYRNVESLYFIPEINIKLYANCTVVKRLLKDLDISNKE